MRSVLWLLAVSACYDAGSIAPCTVSCDLTTDCPGSFECFAHLCASSATDCGPAGPDGNGAICIGDPDGFLPNTCFVSPGPRMLDPVINTDELSCDEPTEPRPGVCIIAGDRLTISTEIEVHGSKPLVLWAASSITVTGALDVSSRFGSAAGAGANDLACMGSAAVDGAFMENNRFIGAGGCGGSFATQGGTGGAGNRTFDNMTSVGLVEGSCTMATVAIDHVRGGCPGGSGGLSTHPLNAGDGGGAIYLMAGEEIIVSGVIAANGAASGPSMDTYGGGGGGGSGGSIGFDAPKLTFGGAQLSALGGSGGSGAGEVGANPPMAVSPGKPGNEPSAAPPANAFGGMQTVNSNAGGNCTDVGGVSGGGVAPNKSGGGGGGGGGTGFIVVFPKTTMPTGVFLAKPDIN